MPFEDRFEAGQEVIDLYDFASERIEPGIYTCETVIDTREATIDAGKPAIDAGKPRHDGAVLNDAGNNVH